MISSDHLVRSIHAHWAAQAPSGVPTIYPGTRADTSRLTDWYELWVDAWSEPPRRNVDPDGLSISLLIHCFSRHPASKTAVQRLATAARQSLARQSLPIVDAESATPRTVGLLRIREHAAHDLSRNHASLGQEHLQHVVLVFQATAHEVVANEE